MKPKSTRKLRNSCTYYDSFQAKSSSCFDFKNFSEALDAVNPSTDGEEEKDNLSTLYDFTDVSNALAAAENEDKEANFTIMKAIIDATHRLLKVRKSIDMMKRIRPAVVGAAERRHKL